MKWFLIFCFLLPLNLYAERDVKKHDDWFDTLDIDDFTDEKVFTVWRWDEDKTNKFSIGYTPNGAYLYLIAINYPYCNFYNDKTTDVLFRVDKNKVFTIPMRKSPQGLFETDPYEIRDRDMWPDYINYQEKMAKGDILRIRVNDESCKKDLKFDLQGFDEAIKRLRDGLLNWLSS
tara:strand:+ start:757 stop:1281 length:525 start_codon:yes stop_codon:yes gene_type:complete